MNESNLTKVKKYGIKCAVCTVLEKVGIFKLKYSDLLIQRYFLSMPDSKREEELKIWFKSETGKELDLKCPKKFNEKIQWLKLYDSIPLKTVLADKFRVRGWVEERIGEKYLIPLLGVWDKFEEIEFDKLPEEYVLKGAHGSGMNVIVRRDKPIDKKEAKKKFDFWMKSYYGIGPMQEWHYRDVPHRIIAEQFIENVGGIPSDYKFYCFNGKPTYVQLIEDRNDDPQMAFFNLDWSDASFTNRHFGKMKKNEEKPKQLEKAIELATKLSEGFAFVRVDLYFVSDEDIYFGEMTFTPASGVSHWVPEEADEMLGKMITLPKEKYIFK